MLDTGVLLDEAATRQMSPDQACLAMINIL